LNRLERGILDLTIKCVDTVKSPKLAEVLMAIVQKLQQATESIVDRITRIHGLPLARKLSCLAVNWGNTAAIKWASDLGFARFLAVLQNNS